MTDIVELERRITSAMGRIERGLARLAAPGSAQATTSQPVAATPMVSGSDAGWQTARIAQLETALEDEKLVTAQLEERVRSLKERQETGPSDAAVVQNAQAAVEAALVAQGRAKDRLATMETEVEALRRSNQDLREMVAKLRTAMEAEVATPDLVNRALKAELDALRATRAADAAELDAVIEELKPLIEEAR